MRKCQACNGEMLQAPNPVRRSAGSGPIAGQRDVRCRARQVVRPRTTSIGECRRYRRASHSSMSNITVPASSSHFSNATLLAPERGMLYYSDYRTFSIGYDLPEPDHKAPTTANAVLAAIVRCIRSIRRASESSASIRVWGMSRPENCVRDACVVPIARGSDQRGLLADLQGKLAAHPVRVGGLTGLALLKLTRSSL
jgi:hypothetical protein